MVTGSMVPAVFAAADNAITSLLKIATTTPGSPFEKRKADELAFEGGRVFVKADGAAGGVPSPTCSDAPTFASSPAAANRKGHSAGHQQSRSSRPTPSAVTSSRSHGSRQSRGCASIAS